jgi:hypothetical protein
MFLGCHLYGFGLILIKRRLFLPAGAGVHLYMLVVIIDNFHING